MTLSEPRNVSEIGAPKNFACAALMRYSPLRNPCGLFFAIPLRTVKQIKSQRAMTALQPHMKEIQKKYKDDRQKQSEEMMKLYKEHKTNPLASCFPILAQAPIFFALFTVLNGIAKNKPHGFV